MWLNKTLDVCASQFFQKRGVSEAMSIYELFNAVSGLNIPIGAEDEFIAEVNTHRERVGFIWSLFQVNDVVLSDRLWRWRKGTRITCRGEEKKPSLWPPKTAVLLKTRSWRLTAAPPGTLSSRQWKRCKGDEQRTTRPPSPTLPPPTHPTHRPGAPPPGCRRNEFVGSRSVPGSTDRAHVGSALCLCKNH